MAEKITKTEAVRRALTELGNNAMPVAIAGWVKDKLGIEMTPGHVSTTKGQLLRDAGKETAPIPAVPAALDPQPPRLTKNEAVRLAVVELGKEANRVQVQGFVKDRFGIDMGLDHVSTAKALALRTLAEKKPATKKPASVEPKAVSKPKEQPSPAKTATTNGKHIHLADIQALKGLVERVGSEALRTLVDLLAK